MSKPSPSLSTTSTRIRPPVFAELQARIDALAARGAEIVPLHIGDTVMPPPQAARDALAALDPADTSLYRYGATAGVAELRSAIAREVTRHGLDVDASAEVLVGNGGTHALACAARAALDPGDEVLMVSPYWPLAPGIFLACGASVVEVPLTQRLYEDPTLSVVDVLSAAISPRTRAIYFASPNNPDGKVLSKDTLAEIAALAVEHGLWVFSDEVYAHVVFEGAHTSVASLPGMRDRTVVVHSMSKSHALAGARVGFCVAPAPLVAAARRVSTHSGFNVAVAMQRVALAALSDAAFTDAARASYLTARDRVADALDGSDVKFHKAEGATYLFLDFSTVFAAMPPPLRGDRPLLALLSRAVDRGVVLAPGDAFGAGYDACARLCFTAAPLDRVLDGVARLREALGAMLRGEP